MNPPDPLPENSSTDPPFIIVATDHAPTGGVRMLVRKRGGQLRRVWVPDAHSSGPELLAIAAAMLDRWPDRPADATGR
jgi:hypothetical protein